jgi:phage-related protein
VTDRPIFWVGTSREDIRSFPEEARRKAGVQLRALQRGEMPLDFKPMISVGQGVQEIRIRVEGAYRVFYVAKFEEAVYVLHAFHKKTAQTSRKDIEAGRSRYQDMLQYRQEQGR